jgi:hypothetical protein
MRFIKTRFFTAKCINYRHITNGDGYNSRIHEINEIHKQEYGDRDTLVRGVQNASKDVLHETSLEYGKVLEL